MNDLHKFIVFLSELKKTSDKKLIKIKNRPRSLNLITTAHFMMKFKRHLNLNVFEILKTFTLFFHMPL